MKNFVIILVSLLIFTSCAKSKEEQLIADYVQTLGDTKLDLKFKIIEIEKTLEVSASDSLEILNNYFISKRDEKILQFEEDITRKLKEIELNEESLKKENNKIMIELYQSRIETARNDIDRNKKSIDLYKGDCKGTFLEPILESINEYESKGDEILVKKFKVKYSINNPLMGNTKQEVNKFFYLDGLSNKVISSSSE
jgi:hypothetical protein